MEYPDFELETFYRFTLHEVKDLGSGEIATDQNLERKYTKKGLDSFLKKVENDPEVTLDSLENYRVTVQHVENRIQTLRTLIGQKSEAASHGKAE